MGYAGALVLGENAEVLVNVFIGDVLSKHLGGIVVDRLTGRVGCRAQSLSCRVVQLHDELTIGHDARVGSKAPLVNPSYRSAIAWGCANRVPKKSPLFHCGRAGASASSRAIS